MKTPSFLAIFIALPCLFTSAPAAEPAPPGDQNTADEAAAKTGNLNKPEKLEAFRDQALGMFIHWSVDSQLGSVISHSLVGADDDYERRVHLCQTQRENRIREVVLIDAEEQDSTAHDAGIQPGRNIKGKP